MRKETTEVLERVLEIFNESNRRWQDLRTVFVDKDFAQEAAITRSLPATQVLLCAFHVMKAVKTKLAKLRVDRLSKEETLTLFKRLMYARNEKTFSNME